jgi:hypothetical protein
MSRRPNTNFFGDAWTEVQKQMIWSKARVVPGRIADEWRQDKCGSLMRWQDHGNRESLYGWEIDHIWPVSSRGSDEPDNLQALNWKNNASKSDSLTWRCPS